MRSNRNLRRCGNKSCNHEKSRVGVLPNVGIQAKGDREEKQRGAGRSLSPFSVLLHLDARLRAYNGPE